MSIRDIRQSTIDMYRIVGRAAWLNIDGSVYISIRAIEISMTALVLEELRANK